MANRDLFTSLHRWARRQDENFTTEALTGTIDLLLKREPSVGVWILKKLTDGAVNVSPENVPIIELNTQPITDQGIPDISVETPDTLVYIEAKVSSGLGRGQLESYRQKLEESGKNSRLVLLTHYPVKLGKSDVAHSLRWYNIGEWLEEALKHSIADQASQYVVEEFLRFLRGRGLSLLSVQSPISAAVRDYKMAVGENSILKKRFRSLETLASEPKLAPLFALLTMIDQTLQLLNYNNVKFDSGQQKGGWVGYNINSMEYFISIYYNRPDVVAFETFSRVIKKEFPKEFAGEVYKSYGKLRWRNMLDLSDKSLGFFSMTKISQLRVLEQFISDSLTVSLSVSHEALT